MLNVDSELSVAAYYKTPGHKMYSNCINFIGSDLMCEMKHLISVKECIFWQ